MAQARDENADFAAVLVGIFRGRTPSPEGEMLDGAAHKLMDIIGEQGGQPKVNKVIRLALESHFDPEDRETGAFTRWVISNNFLAKGVRL